MSALSYQLQFTFLNDLPLTQQAVAFAQSHHADQRRLGDGAAYLMHLMEVASLLQRAGCRDEIVAAAVLHDVLEDTDARRKDLDEQFGVEVGALVSAVSDDPRIAGEEERKDEVRERVRANGHAATILYAADKISKVRELRFLMATDPLNPEIKVRMARYRKSLAMLEEKIPDTRLVAGLRFEIEALVQLPPRPAVGRWPQSGRPLEVTIAALREDLDGLRQELRSPKFLVGDLGMEQRWRRVFELRAELLSAASLIERVENQIYEGVFRDSPIENETP